MDKNNMKQTILRLTLEIIHLLTGEDYTVVKKTSDNYWISGTCPDTSGERSRNRDSPSRERNNVHKLLELARKMVELLTAEVPIRCQDVAVYLSMEEWEYVEGHKDLYQDIMEDLRPRTPSAGFGNEDQKEELNPSASILSYRKPEGRENNGNVQGIIKKSNSRNREQAELTSKTQYPSRNVEEKVCCDRGKPEIHNPVLHTMRGVSPFIEESCNERNFTHLIDQTPQYPFTYIKEELVSYNGEGLTEPNIYTPTAHTQQDTSTLIKEEPASCDGGEDIDCTQYRIPSIKKEPDLCETVMDLNIPTPTDYTQHLTTLIKKEPFSCYEHDTYTPIDHIQYPPPHVKEELVSCDEDDTYTPIDNIHYPPPHVKEEPVSCDEDDTYTPIDNIHYPPPHVKEEPVSCDEDLTEPNSYTPTDHIQHHNPHIKEEPVPYDGENLTDSFVYAPPDHTHYILLPVKEEPVSINNGTLIDLNDYSPRDQHTTTHIKEETLSCHQENPIDRDSHTPTDHRQQHPRTHLKEINDKDVADTNSDTSLDLIPCVEQEPASCNGESLMEIDVCATVDSTHQHGSTHINNQPIPTDHSQYTSRQEPVIKESPLQNHKATSPGEPEAEDTNEKRENEIEHNYIDLTVRSKKFFCTIQQTTNSFQILYNCPECPACFTSNVDLARHQLNHTRRLPFICSLCGRCFGRKSDLVVHQVFHGRDTDTSTHLTQLDTPAIVDGTDQYRPCHVNNKPDYDGGNSTKLDGTKPSDHTQQYPSVEKPVSEGTKKKQKHESSSLGKLENKGVYKKRKKQLEQNYNEVTVSNKKFCTIQQTTDSFEILYNCPECPEFFTSNLDLAKHQIIHAGGMSITCAVCGMSFGRKSDLLIHQLTHAGSNDLAQKNS